jgi:hypothetical protein
MCGEKSRKPKDPHAHVQSKYCEECQIVAAHFSSLRSPVGQRNKHYSDK